MDEYIERDALIKLMESKKLCFDTLSDALYAKQLISSYPASDVVEVVRCKDCVHYDGKDAGR